MWNILIGFPGEAEATLRKYLLDIPLLTHLPAPLAVIPVRFDRFSPYFTLAQEHKLKLKPFDFYEMVYPFEAKALENLAYFFMDDNFDAEYQVNVARYYTPLNEKVQLWKGLWNAEAEDPIAMLYWKGEGDGTRVHDSRSGTAREFPIGATARRILDFLDDPASSAKLTGQFPDLGPARLEEEVASLRQQGLVFEEEGRLLNLVLPGPPPPRESMGHAISVLIGTRGLRRYRRDGGGIAV
jgi:hypothetical protein